MIRLSKLNLALTQMWSEIKETFKSVTHKYVPKKLTTRNFQQPWFNSNFKRLTKQKKRWFYKLKNNDSEQIREKYQQIKKECQQACRTAHTNYLKTMFDGDKTNKKLWSYVKSKNQEQTGIPDLKDKDQNIITEAKEKANSLNNQFTSVFSNPAPEINHSVKESEKYPTMRQIKINKNGVLKLLTNVKEHKATGPDDIPGKLLKLLAEDIVDTYTLLF